MSLINQMLQDLDARRAAHGVGVKLPSEIRPLPPAPASRWPWMMAALAGIAVVAAGIFFILEQDVDGLPVPFAVLAPSPVVLLDDPAASTRSALGSRSVASDATFADLPESVSSTSQEALPPVSAPELGASLRVAEVLSEPSKKLHDDKAPADKHLPTPQKDERRDERRAALTSQSAPQNNAAVAVVLPALPVVDDRAPRTVSIEKTDATELPRDRVEAVYRKAIAAVNQGRVNEALDMLQDVLRQDNLHVAARQLQVRLLLEAGRVEEVIQVLQDGLQVLPAQTGWAMSLARLQLERGEVKAAAQTLQYSMPLASANPDYLGFTAHVLQRLQRHREAVDLYQAATRIAPGDGRWWLGLGLSLESGGRNDQSVAAFQRAYQAGNLSPELMALVEQKLR